MLKNISMVNLLRHTIQFGISYTIANGVTETGMWQLIGSVSGSFITDKKLVYFGKKSIANIMDY